jgi:hypothetical protein
MLEKLIRSIEKIKGSKHESLENLSPYSSTEVKNELSTSAAITFIVISVFWVFLVLFLGKYLWNNTLTNVFTGIKKVTMMQFIGLFILIQIFFPVCLN